LRRDQLERLLSRGYELAFKTAVLTRFDLMASQDTVELLHPRERRAGHLALVHWPCERVVAGHCTECHLCPLNKPPPLSGMDFCRRHSCRAAGVEVQPVHFRLLSPWRWFFETAEFRRPRRCLPRAHRGWSRASGKLRPETDGEYLARLRILASERGLSCKKGQDRGVGDDAAQR
jgi:hypothetical protein